MNKDPKDIPLTLKFYYYVFSAKNDRYSFVLNTNIDRFPLDSATQLAIEQVKKPGLITFFSQIAQEDYEYFLKRMEQKAAMKKQPVKRKKQSKSNKKRLKILKGKK